MTHVSFRTTRSSLCRYQLNTFGDRFFDSRALGLELASRPPQVHMNVQGSFGEPWAEGEPRQFAAFKPATLPLFFGTVVYSFEGVCNMLPVENALRNPDDVFPVLYVGMLAARDFPRALRRSGCATKEYSTNALCPVPRLTE